MVPASTVQSPVRPAVAIDEKIRNETEQNIAIYASAGSALINKRLKELDKEWDVERALETNASIAALIGLFLAATVNRKWFALPVLVTGFLLQHAVRGWSPPVALLRRLGFRTRAELERERYAMKILRGDFENMPKPDEDFAAQAGEILKAGEK
jgi:hypothetical protein